MKTEDLKLNTSKMKYMVKQEFRRLARMLNHVHKKRGPKPGPKCNICGETCDTYVQMDYHRAILHRNRVSCTECGKVYPGSQLQYHMSNTHAVCEHIIVKFVELY